MNELLKKISIGGAQFGMDYGINNRIGKTSSKEIYKILSLAFKSGINSIDTAKSYGDSEKCIGSFLKEHKSNWNITTKVSNEKLSLKDQLKDSKSKLGQEPNVLLAHSSNLWSKKNFQFEISKLKSINRNLKTGVSCYNKREIENALKDCRNLDIIQIPISVLDTRLLKDGTIKHLLDMKIEINARSVFLQGLFFLPESIIKEKFKNIVDSMNHLKEIILGEDLTLAEFSLLFVLKLEQIKKVIIGIDSYGQLESNISTINKNVNDKIFSDALQINFQDEKILNPSLW